MAMPPRKPTKRALREGLPAWVRDQCGAYFYTRGLLECVTKSDVTNRDWETIRKEEVALGTPEGAELHALANILRFAVASWNSDWKLTATQKQAKADELLALIQKLKDEIAALDSDAFFKGGQWHHVVSHDPIALDHQVQGLKKSILAWRAFPAPVSRPTGANAERNHFIWYVANSFKQRYGRPLLDVVHACACAHFDSALELERSAVSKIARSGGADP